MTQIISVSVDEDTINYLKTHGGASKFLRNACIKDKTEEGKPVLSYDEAEELETARERVRRFVDFLQMSKEVQDLWWKHKKLRGW